MKYSLYYCIFISVLCSSFTLYSQEYFAANDQEFVPSFTKKSALYLTMTSSIKPSVLLREKIDTLNASSPDTVKRHSPKKASLRSAILPGWGQAYNKKHWKIPVIYAGIGTGIYFIASNTITFNKYKKAYIYRTDDNSSTIDNIYANNVNVNENLSLETLQLRITDAKRNIDLSYIITGVVYLLNIVDASVDAHFINFNVDDNLSINMTPYSSPSNSIRFSNNLGIKLTYKL